jgi:hypothetical protein
MTIRPYILLAGILLTASPSFAQGIGFGVKGGLNVATQDVSNAEPLSFDPRFGLVAGGFVTLPLGSIFDVQVEGLYSEKGARLKNGGGEAKLLVNYLEVPALVRVRLAHIIYAAGGPSMGFRLQAKTRTRFSGSTDEIDVSDQVERFDFGVAMGGGLLLGPLVVDGRYTLGLTNIDKDKSGSSETKNRTISLTLGIRF